MLRCLLYIRFSKPFEIEEKKVYAGKLNIFLVEQKRNKLGLNRFII